MKMIAANLAGRGEHDVNILLKCQTLGIERLEHIAAMIGGSTQPLDGDR
jgi:hypothetical protein